MPNNPNKIQTIVIQMLKELDLHWQDFREPWPIYLLQRRFTPYLARLGMGIEWRDFWERMMELGLFIVIRGPTGRRWVFTAERWNSLGLGERERWKRKLQNMKDPMYKSSKYRSRNEPIWD